MDLSALVPLAGTSLVTAAALFTAVTPTPNPTTRWGKVYRVIDRLALNVGHAKDKGLIPTDPAADKIAAEVVDVAKGALGVAAAAAMLTGVVACSAISTPDPATAEARIVAACAQTGLFEAVDGRVAVAVKEARIPVAVVNAGLDRICANPALVAQDAAAVESVVRALATVQR